MTQKTRLLDYDPVTQVRRLFHPSDDGESFVEEGQQEISERLSINKALRNDPSSGWGEGRRVASIPIVIWEHLIRQGMVTAGGQILDEKKFKAWLNDPDNRAFRTRLGQV